MNRKLLSIVLIAVVLLAVLMSVSGVTAQQSPDPTLPQAVLGTAFTYQGQLQKGGAPVTANCLMAFRLYDQVSDGNVRVVLCMHGGLTGLCETFTYDDPNLSNNAIGNDEVTSAQIEWR